MMFSIWRSPSRRSDLGGFYQLMNALKRLRCLSGPRRLLPHAAPKAAAPPRQSGKERGLIVDLSRPEGEKDVNVDEISSVPSEERKVLLGGGSGEVSAAGLQPPPPLVHLYFLSFPPPSSPSSLPPHQIPPPSLL